MTDVSLTFLLICRFLLITHSLSLLLCVFWRNWVIYPVEFLLSLGLAGFNSMVGLMGFHVFCISCKLIVESSHHLVLKLKSRRKKIPVFCFLNLFESPFLEKNKNLTQNFWKLVRKLKYIFPNYYIRTTYYSPNCYVILLLYIIFLLYWFLNTDDLRREAAFSLYILRLPLGNSTTETDRLEPGQGPAFVNKVLLAHGHRHSFTHCLWLLSHCNSRGE